MKYFIYAFLFVSCTCPAQNQDTLDLFQCRQSAVEGHPSFARKDLYARSSEVRIKNLKTNWYPSLDLNGSYTWQNEVVELPFGDAIPGITIPEVPHDNYKLTVDVRQTVYDGGITKASREMEESGLLVNQGQVDVNLHQLKENVDRVYFSILLLQQQEKTIRLKLEVLKQRMSSLESGVRNELFLASDLDVLKAEILKVEQQAWEIGISESAAFKVLGKLICRDIPDGTVLRLPDTGLIREGEALRPEQALYDLQIEQLDASKKLVSKQKQPSAYVFAQAGYGNLGFNYFKDELRGFYMLGAGLHWTIWDWSKTERTRQDLTLQQEIIRSRKNAYDRNLDIQLEENLAEISKYEEAVRRDEEIVNLRREITGAAASQLENGVITLTDYITQLNAETEARTMLETHRIQYVQSQINYLTTKGII